MLYYKCTTNGGNMRVQKFNSKHFKSINENLKGIVYDLLFRARDRFITSEDDTVIVENDLLGGHEKITIEDKGDYLILTHKSTESGPHGNQETNEFVIRSCGILRTSTLLEISEII